jgi:hypothetical protein
MTYTITRNLYYIFGTRTIARAIAYFIYDENCPSFFIVIGLHRL